MILFEAKNVTKKYGDYKALDNICISIPEHSVYGLLGPNGAGKTTLIRIITQITGPDSGELFFEGRRLKPEDIAVMGYLPEERGLYKKMKVGEQVLYFARLKGLPKSEAMKRLKFWFKRLDILGWWDKKVEELSKGMQQKVQFIITVLHEPKLLIFDEPFSGFDPVNANIIKNEILYLKDRGATIILSTHNMASVEELCDNITLIDKSHSVLEGRVEDIRKQWAANEYEIVVKNAFESDGFKSFSVVDKIMDEDKTTLRLKVNENFVINDVLGDMIPACDIISVNPFLPSMNDIFIRVVSSSK